MNGNQICEKGLRFMDRRYPAMIFGLFQYADDQLSAVLPALIRGESDRMAAVFTRVGTPPYAGRAGGSSRRCSGIPTGRRRAVVRLPYGPVERHALRSLEEGRGEAGARFGGLCDTVQTQPDVVQRQLRENGLRRHKVELLPEFTFELVGNPEVRGGEPVRQSRLGNLTLEPGPDQAAVDIDAEEVRGLRMADEVDAAAQRPAADVQQKSVRVGPCSTR